MDFIGIGSGKCGSTWFFENLVQHPEICDKNPKELNYFSDLYEKQSPEWYASQFAGCDNGLLRGEFSVTYMYRPASAQRIRHDFPDAKILAIVRDPIKRTYSDYLHFIRKGDISRETSFSEYIKDKSHLAFGRYYEYLEDYYRLFPAEQIKVLVLEEMNRDMAAAFHEVYEFLGVKNPDFLPEGVEVKRNAARNYRFLWLENLLVRTYRFMARRGYTRLLERLRRVGIPQLLRALNASKQPVPEMPDESRRVLAEYFRPANRLLSELTRKDLTIWDVDTI